MPKYKSKRRKKLKLLEKNKITLNSIIENEIKKNSLRTRFSKNLEDCSKNIKIEISDDHKNLDDINFITIDGEDSRDFDDAVWAQKKNNEFEIMVAIADVSLFIKENSILDLEARKRGNSFYFPNQVIPMLPQNISNNLCSLVPNKKRACVVVKVNIDLDGNITKPSFFRASIISKARLNYSQVEIFLNDSKKSCLNKELKSLLNNLHSVFKILNKNSIKRGKFDLDVEEVKLIKLKNDEDFNFLKKKNKISNKIIEELMVLANTLVADALIKKKVKTLFRNHEKPSEEKLFKLYNFLNEIGIKFTKKKSIKPNDFQEIINNKFNFDLRSVKDIILKSQSKAHYNNNNKGHFGLSLRNYVHFTSPIRRYSDLVVHRNVVNNLIHKNKDKSTHSSNIITDNLCDHLLNQEKKSELIERTIMDKACCLYLTKTKIKKFHGFVDGLTDFGIFVKAIELPFSGLIFLKDIRDDYYDFNKEKMCVEGRNSGNTFKFGQKVSFKIKNNNIQKGQISLKNLEHDKYE